MQINDKLIFNSILSGTGENIRIALIGGGINPDFPLLRNRKGSFFSAEQSGENITFTRSELPINSSFTEYSSCIESCIRSIAPEVLVDHFIIQDKSPDINPLAICKTIEEAVRQNYQIININTGINDESLIPWLVAIMEKAFEKNIIIVVPSGKISNKIYPAHFTYTISCDAIHTDHPLHIKYNSNSIIEFLASGVDVKIPGPENNELSTTGPSIAAAHITGIIARILEHKPKITPLEVKLMLREYALAIATK